MRGGVKKDSELSSLKYEATIIGERTLREGEVVTKQDDDNGKYSKLRSDCVPLSGTALSLE